MNTFFHSLNFNSLIEILESAFVQCFAKIERDLFSSFNVMNVLINYQKLEIFSRCFFASLVV